MYPVKPAPVRDIMLQDLDFDEISVECRSTRGVHYFRKIKVGMPRIPESVIESVFYLYANKHDAENGRDPRGTGFIVSINDLDYETGPMEHYYGVTTWHVAVQNGSSVIRLNTKDGRADVLEFGPDEWQFIPGADDIAVIPLDLDGNIHKISSINTFLFAHESERQEIGVGDDVFMLGLFIDHEERTTNVPKARFGNISMMPSPNALIQQPNKYMGESYICDLRSRSGFSGSPVFVYRTPLSDISGDPSQGHYSYRSQLTGSVDLDDVERVVKHDLKWQLLRNEFPIRLKVDGTLFRFLGIHWGQFEEIWESRGAYIKGNSGMTCVIPSWKIMEVLFMPKLKAERDRKTKGMKRPPPPTAEFAPTIPPSDAVDQPTHEQRFNQLLDDAVLGVKPK